MDITVKVTSRTPCLMFYTPLGQSSSDISNCLYTGAEPLTYKTGNDPAA